jgi:hypothetical protein
MRGLRVFRAIPNCFRISGRTCEIQHAFYFCWTFVGKLLSNPRVTLIEVIAFSRQLLCLDFGTDHRGVQLDLFLDFWWNLSGSELTIVDAFPLD